MALKPLRAMHPSPKPRRHSPADKKSYVGNDSDLVNTKTKGGDDAKELCRAFLNRKGRHCYKKPSGCQYDSTVLLFLVRYAFLSTQKPLPASQHLLFSTIVC